jgi:hypothetical protein
MRINFGHMNINVHRVPPVAARSAPHGFDGLVRASMHDYDNDVSEVERFVRVVAG